MINLYIEQFNSRRGQFKLAYAYAFIFTPVFLGAKAPLGIASVRKEGRKEERKEVRKEGRKYVHQKIENNNKG